MGNGNSLKIAHITKQKLKKINERITDLESLVYNMPLKLYYNLFTTQSYHTEVILNCFPISSFFVGLARFA